MQLDPEQVADACDYEPLLLQVKQALENQSLAVHRAVLESWLDSMQLDALECAAALLHVAQATLPKAVTASPLTTINKSRRINNRLVRYRLDVGSEHQVSREQIQMLLVEESGVDKKRIGRIDIRHNHTLVELPDGMPADIFQILFDTRLADRKLAIKRIKPNRRFKSRDS